MLSALSQSTNSLSRPLLPQLNQTQAGSPSRLSYLGALLKEPQSNVLDTISEDYFQLEHDFETILKQAEEAPVSDQNITPPWINTLKETARKPEWQKTLGEYVLDKHKAEVETLQKQYAQRSLMLEQKEKEENLANTSSQYSKLNSSMANFEAQISEMKKKSRAVFVGSGPQPNTVISYARFSKNVTGIDSDAEAIPPAIAAADATKRKERINFEHIEGKDFNYQNYSHIGMAIMIPTEAKIEILQQILNTAKTGTRVVVRSVDGLKKALYNGIDEKAIKDLHVNNAQQPGSQKVFKKVATIYGNDDNVTHSYILEVAEKKAVQGAPQFGHSGFRHSGFGHSGQTQRRLNLVG